MVSTLKGDLLWSKPEDSLRGVVDSGAEKNELLELTEEFIRLERAGIKKYKK